MVTGSRASGNRMMGLDDSARKMIQSIKEVLGNHSDADIYSALKQANMDADEAVQKLIHQDSFHEVKRKRDRKKEEKVVESANSKKPLENVTSEGKVCTQPEHNVRRGGHSRNFFPKNAESANSKKPLENVSSEVKVCTQPEHNVRRGGHSRNFFPRNAAPRHAFPRNRAAGSNREFRIVKDNRSNPNAEEELKLTDSAHSSGSNVSKVVATVNKKGSTGGLGSDHSSGAQNFTDDYSAPADVRPIPPFHRQKRKEVSGGKQTEGGVTLPSSNSVPGVNSSSTDSAKVQSPVSRSSPDGAIKREERGKGFSGKPSENIDKDPSIGSSSGSFIEKNGSPNAQPSSSTSKIDDTQTTARESVMPSMVEKNRSFLNRRHGFSGGQYARSQEAGGRTKGVSQNKQWKPKSSQKRVGHNPGVIGTPTKSQANRPVDNSSNLESKAIKLQEKLAHVHISEQQNVIIADHIRVPETEHCQLTFGSFVPESDLQKSHSPEERREADHSLPATCPEASTNGPGVQPVNILDDHARISLSNSPVSAVSEPQLPEQKEIHRSDNLEEYSGIQLPERIDPPYTSKKFEQKQDPPEYSQAYDNHGSYGYPYFNPAMDETIQGQGLPSHQEALNTHMVNDAPSSTIPMLQQQQQQALMQQMYPQVHVSHYPNLMPYRQFLSPVYVPQMPMAGYSGNPAAYTHPSNGNSYVMMPGGGSHLSSNGVKYGIHQQFKPVPAAGPTGFGNYNNPNGYPNVVGNVTGLEDSSRMKYKDGNMYIPNPQAETSEIWMQNPRNLSNLQSSTYYNVAGQPPHGAYQSFNTAAAAAAQSSHMQFQGLFHPPQPGTMTNLHHMGPGLGGNVGVVPSTPPSQVGTYQQSHLGHPNWPANF